jgi:small-conductance mechanosensitive channel
MNIFKIIRYIIEAMFVVLILGILFIGVDDLVIDNDIIYILLMSFIFLLMAVEDRILGAIHSKKRESNPEGYNDIKKGLVSTALLTLLLGIVMLVLSPFDVHSNAILIKLFFTLSMFASISMTFYKISKG